MREVSWTCQLQRGMSKAVMAAAAQAFFSPIPSPCRQSPTGQSDSSIKMRTSFSQSTVQSPIAVYTFEAITVYMFEAITVYIEAIAVYIEAITVHPHEANQARHPPDTQGRGASKKKGVCHPETKFPVASFVQGHACMYHDLENITSDAHPPRNTTEAQLRTK